MFPVGRVVGFEFLGQMFASNQFSGQLQERIEVLVRKMQIEKLRVVARCLLKAVLLRIRGNAGVEQIRKKIQQSMDLHCLVQCTVSTMQRKN